MLAPAPLRPQGSALPPPLRAGRRAVRVSDGQNVHRLQVLRQAEGRLHRLRLEVTDPHRAQPQGRRRQHHVVGEDGRVDVCGLLAVKGPLPRPAPVGAHHHRQGRAVELRRSGQPSAPVRRLRHQQAHRLAIGGGGGRLGRLQKLLHLFRLYRPVLILAHRIARPNQFQKSISDTPLRGCISGRPVLSSYPNPSSAQECTFRVDTTQMERSSPMEIPLLRLYLPGAGPPPGAAPGGGGPGPRKFRRRRALSARGLITPSPRPGSAPCSPG